MKTRRGRMMIALLFLPFLFFFQSVFAQTTYDWKHPGVLLSQAQLDFIKAQVDAKQEPYYQQFLKARDGKYGAKNYVPAGPPSDGVIQCGSYSNPDKGCSSAHNDTAAAYTQALLWYITGEQVYADNAIEIMNVYAKNFKGYGGTKNVPCAGAASTCSNGPLQAAWDSTKWPRAAEIIRYGRGGSAGWSQADQLAFQVMLNKSMVPAIYDGSKFNGNWEISMIEGMMGIAVFNEDIDLLRHAQLFWKQRIPAYFYNYVLDNPLYPNDHAPFPEGRETSSDWNGQQIFSAATTGVTQETCRDLKHTEYGLASALNAAETDYIQGGALTADLYTADGAQDRLVTAMNLMAGMELTGSKNAPANFCTKGSGNLTLGKVTTFLLGYNEYHNRLNDPNMSDASGTKGLWGTSNTYNWIQNGVLTQKEFTDSGAHMVIYESLTHLGNANFAPSYSISADPFFQQVKAGTAANYTVKVSPTAGYSGTVLLSVDSGLPAGSVASFNPAQITGGSGSSTLTIITAANTVDGNYAINIKGNDGSIAKTTGITLGVTSSAVIATITANNVTLLQGNPIPTFTYSVSPLVSFSKFPTCSTTASSSSPAGSYPITCSGAEADGYTFKYVAATLTIKTGILVTIIPETQRIKQGEAMPTLTFKMKPKDAVLTKQPTCKTTATSSSPKGKYSITCSGAEGVGYTFKYTEGTFVVR